MTTATKKEKKTPTKAKPSTAKVDEERKQTQDAQEVVDETIAKREQREGEGSTPERTGGEQAQELNAAEILAQKAEARVLQERQFGPAVAAQYAEGVSPDDIVETWHQVPFKTYYWLTRVDGEAGCNLFLQYENPYRETWSALDKGVGQNPTVGNPVPQIIGEFFGTRASTPRGRFIVRKSYFDSKIDTEADVRNARMRLEEAEARAKSAAAQT